MGRRKLVVALVGAIGLSLMVSPADAATSSVVIHQAPAGLVVQPCTTPPGVLRLAVRAAGRVLVARALVLQAEVARLHALHHPVVVDVEVTALNTAIGGTAIAVAEVHRAREVEVTAVNTGIAGTAIAVADVHRASRVDVTAVNTATLGTAVAVATPAPSPSKSTKDTTSNVTAINTGILGQAVAVGGGGNGDVTAINTGILGTAIAVGGGGSVGYPIL